MKNDSDRYHFQIRESDIASTVHVRPGERLAYHPTHDTPSPTVLLRFGRCPRHDSLRQVCVPQGLSTDQHGCGLWTWSQWTLQPMNITAVGDTSSFSLSLVPGAPQAWMQDHLQSPSARTAQPRSTPFRVFAEVFLEHGVHVIVLRAEEEAAGGVVGGRGRVGSGKASISSINDTVQMAEQSGAPGADNPDDITREPLSIEASINGTPLTTARPYSYCPRHSSPSLLLPSASPLQGCSCRW